MTPLDVTNGLEQEGITEDLCFCRWEIDAMARAANIIMRGTPSLEACVGGLVRLDTGSGLHAVMRSLARMCL